MEIGFQYHLQGNAFNYLNSFLIKAISINFQQDKYNTISIICRNILCVCVCVCKKEREREREREGEREEEST